MNNLSSPLSLCPYRKLPFQIKLQPLQKAPGPLPLFQRSYLLRYPPEVSTLISDLLGRPRWRLKPSRPKAQNLLAVELVSQKTLKPLHESIPRSPVFLLFQEVVFLKALLRLGPFDKRYYQHYRQE